MTISHDQNWYEVPTLAETDMNKDKNKTYWDKERLAKFWGKNPTQEFNDFNATQSEFNSQMDNNNSPKKYKLLSEMDDSEFKRALCGGEHKSSKMIRRFASGAVRSDDTGRIRPDYISPYGLSEIAEHFTVAKNDFGATNYFMGIEPKDILPSVMRHMLEFQEGVMKNDKGMVRSALRSLGANAIMGLHQIVLEEKGEYVTKYDKTELVDADMYLSELEQKQNLDFKERQRELLVAIMRADEELGLYDDDNDDE